MQVTEQPLTPDTLQNQERHSHEDLESPANPMDTTPPSQELPTKTYRAGYVYSSVANAALGAFFFGYVMSAFNPISAFVQPHGFSHPVADILITLMTSFVPLGAGAGALSAGKIASSVGRRKAMLIIDVIAIIGTVLTLLPQEYLLLFGRLIQGYCVGANSSIVPLWINEVSPTEIAGRMGTFNQLFVSFGVLLAPIIGLGMPTGAGDDVPTNQFFRVILGVAGIAPLLRMVLNFTVFRSETPKYLISVGKEDEALAVLNKLYTEKRAEEEYTALRHRQQLEARSGTITLAQLFTTKYRFRLLVAVLVAMLQQLSGINAIIFFSNTIFETGSAKGTIMPTVYTVIMDILQIVGVLVAGVIIEKLGRRFMLIAGMAFSAAVLGAFGILGLIDPTSEGGKFLIWAYVLGFGLSLGPLPWVYISDILPDIGIGIAVLSNWITTFGIGLIFPIAAQGGMGGPFLFFAGCCLLGTVFKMFNVKETGGKTESEIAAMFGYKGEAPRKSSKAMEAHSPDQEGQKLNKI